MSAKYLGREIIVGEHVYPPSEDTFLLLKAAIEEVRDSESVLEVGTGCGIIAKFLGEKARVVAVDLNPHAARCARANGVEVIRTDLLAGLKPEKQFDIIIFNPPYLPAEGRKSEGWLEKAWDGGENGRTLIDRFLKDVRSYLKADGRLLLLVSSLTGVKEVEEKMQSLGFTVERQMKERYFFEELVVLAGRLQG